MEQAHRSNTTHTILKALGIFGGVQVITILCSVARTKMAALWMGPVGVGIMAVYNSTMSLIANTSQLNIEQSSVRELAVQSDDIERTARLTAAIRRSAIMLSGIAMIFTIVCSPLLSRWAFGDVSHTYDFIALSLWLFFAAVAAAEYAVMRAHRRFKALAASNIWAAVVSLIIALPLIYFYRIAAIVPVFLVYYFIGFVFALIFREKPQKLKTRQSLSETIKIMRPVFSLGAYMTFSAFVTLLSANIFITYLNNNFGEESVGIYQAGYTLINTYVGMIFTAIATEFYPRLSTVIHSRMRAEVVVSHEIKIALLVLMPVLVCFVCLSPLIINILYSADFYDALPFVVIGATGVVLRAVSWCMAYAMLARSDGRVYIITETLSSIIYLALYIPLYNHFGYIGLGAGYVAWYAFYTLIVYYVFRRRYGMRLRSGILALIILVFAVAAATVALFYIIGGWWTLAITLPPTAYIAIRKVRA